MVRRVWYSKSIRFETSSPKLLVGWEGFETAWYWESTIFGTKHPAIGGSTILSHTLLVAVSSNKSQWWSSELWSLFDSMGVFFSIKKTQLRNSLVLWRNDDLQFFCGRTYQGVGERPLCPGRCVTCHGWEFQGATGCSTVEIDLHGAWG